MEQKSLSHSGCHGAWSATPEIVHCSKSGISVAPLNRRVQFPSDRAMGMSVKLGEFMSGCVAICNFLWRMNSANS